LWGKKACIAFQALDTSLSLVSEFTPFSTTPSLVFQTESVLKAIAEPSVPDAITSAGGMIQVHLA
jgi:hypothetical protein